MSFAASYVFSSVFSVPSAGDTFGAFVDSRNRHMEKTYRAEWGLIAFGVTENK